MRQQTAPGWLSPKRENQEDLKRRMGKWRGAARNVERGGEEGGKGREGGLV